MCAPTQGAMLPYGLKVPSPYFPFGPNGGLSQVQLSALDFQRSQMNDYNIRVQLGLRNYQNAVGLSSFHAYFNDPYTQAYFYKHDPRSRFVQEEPKPSHSYIGLIGMAILNSKEKKLVLSDIYQWILDNYPYFRTRGPGWRNSIRHNLSLNDCFIKSGRSANGKGHYWAVHPANVEDFERGDFRRRRAQRKVRRHMGLSVPDDDDSPTPSPTQSWSHHDLTQSSDASHSDAIASPGDSTVRPTSDPHHLVISHSNPAYGPVPGQPRKPSRKRLFDMASLLAPDDDDEDKSPGQDNHIERHHKPHLRVSGFMFHPIQEQKSRNLPTDLLIDQRTDILDSDSAHDLTSGSKLSSSEGVKEMGYLSDDDHENDEIQVTSGEESPSQEHDDSFYTSHSLSVEEKNENDSSSFNGSKIVIETLNEQSNHTSSPRNKECKKDSALDLSSPTYFDSEKKLGDSSNRLDFGESSDCKLPSPRTKDNCIRLLQQHTSQTDDSVITKETGCDKCSVYCGSETISERCVRNTTKANCSGCERVRQKDGDTLMSQLPYRDSCQALGQQMCLTINGTVDHVRAPADNSHYYRTELQEPRRPHNQGQLDTNFGHLDNGLVDSDRHNESDRNLSSESSVFVSEASRVPSDPMRWTDNSKMVISRDRLSAFSSLGMRNHNIYSPFQLRNFSLAPQRLVSATTPMRTGLSDPSLSMTASSSASVSLLNGLNSSASKNSHSSNDIISSKNTNICSNNRE